MIRILCSCLIVVLMSGSSYLTAQRFGNQNVKWVDDNHYTFKNKKYNVKTGDSSEVPEKTSPGENLKNALPDNFEINWQSKIAKDGSSAILIKDEDLYYFKEGMNEPLRLTNDEAKEENPTFSKDEQSIAFTKGGNLYSYDLRQKKETALTKDGNESIYNGWASWVYFEEILGRRSRYKAFWWSPNNTHIAFLRFDDNPVPTFTIVRASKTNGDNEVNHYPKAGDPNPEVKMGIVEVSTGKITWVETQENKDYYTAWPFWNEKGDQLYFQELNRDQNKLKIVSTDLTSGKKKLVYSEEQKTWVQFFNDITFVDGGFILRSNKSGWSNLYYYKMSGELIRQLTDYDWDVTSIVKVADDQLFFYGTGKINTDRHLYVVDIKTGENKQLTKEGGMHTASISPGGNHFIASHSNYETPSSRTLYEVGKGKIREIEKGKENKNTKAGIKVEMTTVKTDDGLFDMPVKIVYPPGFSPDKKYPIIFGVYGGPGAQSVRNSYRSYTNDNLIMDGVISISFDHRGSGKFGKKGLDYLHRSLGKWEMEDIITVVKWIKKKGFIDDSRIGIAGGSYGGYYSALALTQGADYFTHAVSNFPVTDWRLYDNVYTERYMDTPQDNKAGYDEGSVLTYAENLKGELLIIHGMMDDNVHAQNTMQLISKLQDLDKDFELMVYPGERHGWGGPKRAHSSRLIENFWRKHFSLDRKVQTP